MKKYLKILLFTLIIAMLCFYNTSFSADETNTSQQEEESSTESEIILTNIYLNFTNITVSVSSSETWNLVVFGNPSNATLPEIVWSSSDNNIVTIQPGETNTTAAVKPIAVGNAIITAKTIDGKFSATCNVKVTSDTLETIDTEDNTIRQEAPKAKVETTVQDTTVKTGILPKTGIKFQSLILILAIVTVSLISYKGYKKYKGI